VDFTVIGWGSVAGIMKENMLGGNNMMILLEVIVIFGAGASLIFHIFRGHVR